MDTKRLVIVMLLSMALIFAWQWGNIKLAEMHPEWYPKPAPPAAQTQPAAAGGTGAGPVATTQAAPATAPAIATGLRAVPANPSTAVLGFPHYDTKHEHANWPVALSINSLGASLDAATLNQYKKTAHAEEPYVFQTPYQPVSEAVGRAFITRTIYVDGAALDLSNVHFRLVEKSDTRATYAVDVIPAGSDKPITIQKTFELRDATRHPGLGYEVGIRYTVTNTTGQPRRVKLAFNGPNIPTIEGLRETPEIIAAFTSDPARNADITLMNKTASGFKPNADSTDIDALKDTPFLWAGSMSAYFDAIVRPPVVNGKAVNIGDVRARALAPPGDTGEAFINLYFETPELALADQPLTLPLEVYLGPRGRFVLDKGTHFPAFPLQYDKTLVLTGGWCGICTWTWLINVLVWMLSIFQFVFRDWGLAIMGLVIVVRLALHPITKKSQVSMARMGKLAPEMERLKEKYKDDKEGMNRAMMQLYKEQGFIPILGCLPILLQMPIWIALWAALQSTFELRQAPFLWGMTWIRDLSQPDSLIPFSQAVKLPILGLLMGPINGLNILPLLLGVVFYVSAKLQPKPPTMTPEQAQQQKMMLIMMPLIFPLMLYSGPSGLNLYILTSTAIGIWESKRVRAHIKEQEEREKAGPVIVDAPQRKGGKDTGRTTGKVTPVKPAGGLSEWLANLQKRADDLRGGDDKTKR